MSTESSSPLATQRLTFSVTGMDCAEEIATLRSALTPIPGVVGLDFDLLHRKLVVQLSGPQPSSDTIIGYVKRTGMRATLWDSPANENEKSDNLRRLKSLSTGLSGMLLFTGFSIQLFLTSWKETIGATESVVPWVARILYTTATISGGWFIVPKAWFALRRIRPDMNLLMTMAVAGAFGIGEYFEAAAVTFLFALSLALEQWSIGRARKAIEALMAMSPTKARIVSNNGNEELVDAASVSVGTRVIIKPGEKFPLDGRIVAGTTTVNQAPITGESTPITKEVGSEVFAGTLNEDGAVEVQTVKPFAESTLSQIVKMVGEAHANRAPAEQWVERFARIYTPVVLVAAVLLALIPPLFTGEWGRWIYQSLVLLVIACPCALVISTPVSIVAGLVAAARNGILIKGGKYLEQASHVQVVAMDKTGTLTCGKMQVISVTARSGHTTEELLSIAAALETRSTHPLANAIVKYAKNQGVEVVPASAYQAIPGKGARAQLGGKEHWLGSHRYLEERNQETPDVHKELESLTAKGRSIVVIGNESHVCGYIGLADKLRPDAKKVLEDLRAAGIQHIVMLTGDNAGTAKTIGEEVGVDEIRAELLPQDKVRAVAELVERRGVTAMVGDGVNDAPALARSSLGIAMGAAGTDAALETSDVVLMGDDLSKLPWLIKHSRRTTRIIRENIIASMAVKALFVVLSFSGHASLWGAIAADTGMSLLVVLNALRLTRAN